MVASIKSPAGAAGGKGGFGALLGTGAHGAGGSGASASAEEQRRMIPRWIIMGTDGLFEFLSNEDIARLAIPARDGSGAKMRDAAELSNALVGEAYSRWLQVRHAMLQVALLAFSCNDCNN